MTSVSAIITARREIKDRSIIAACIVAFIVISELLGCFCLILLKQKLDTLEQFIVAFFIGLIILCILLIIAIFSIDMIDKICIACKPLPEEKV